MNTDQKDKKIGQSLTQPHGAVVRLTLFLVLAFSVFGSAATANAASKTWVPTTGGVWTTAGNWNPSGAPAEGDDVTIPADQSANITAVPAMTLSNLTINGTCVFAAATSGTALTVSNSFMVISGKTLTLGAPSARLSFTLASTATGTIAGTVVITSGGGTFLCNGDLTMTSTGIINGPGIFTLSAGATLRIGSTAGISSSGSSGSIQVSGGLNYSPAANYIYNGTANQNTGTGLPSNLTGSLTINNPGNTVTLNNAETIASGGTLNIVSGTFATGTSLTMATTSSINRSGGTMTGTLQGTGVYNVTYTGNSMTTSSELSGAGLNNVTVNLSAGQTLTLGANASPDGNLSVNSGALDLSTFTMNRSATGGTFTLANGASLLVGGASNFPANYSTVSLGATSTVNYDAAGAQNVSAQTYGNLILSGSGAKSIVSGTSITGNLSITSGSIASIGSGLVIPVGSLTLGGLGEANGTWGSTTATLATFHNDTYFTATTGYLNVSSDIRTTPTVTAWPTASSIVYGQTLASSVLSGGSASVPGTFAFTTPSTAPNAGTGAQSVTFTPSDLSTYTTTNSTVNVTVAKAAPNVTAWPTASPITYGQTLAASSLSGGSAFPAGSFAFTTPSTAPNAGTAAQSVTYTPVDTANYNTASSTVSVTVNKANPNVTAWPTASTITYGQTLAASTLSGGSATPAGSFAFTTPSTTPNAGTASQSVTYTPTDTANYNPVSSTVSLTVNKADPNVTTWPSATAITYGQTLASSTLSGGSATPAGSFAFTTPSTTPNAGTASQSVTYTPTDTANYNTASSTVSLTVNKADPNVTTWPSATTITYGQTLASSTLSGGSATPPGSFAFTTPSTAPSVGTGSQSVTYTPTDTANYNTASGTASVTVNPKTLTVTGITAEDKAYDGDTTATLDTASAALVGVVADDDVTLNISGASGAFSDANAGTGKTVQINGLTLGGTAMGNYVLTQPTATASITSPSPGNLDDGLSVWIVLDTGNHYLEMSFRRNKNAAAMGLQYTPEVSGDKQTWFSDNPHVSELSVVSFDSQFDLVTVRALTPITTVAPRFARLSVVAMIPSPVQTTSQVWIGTDTAIQGNGGSGTKFTTFSQRMIRPVAAAGTVSSLQNAILTDNNATWTDGQYGTNGIRSYVEFDSGWTVDIANSSGSSKTLTLAGDPGGIVSIDDPYRIRSHFTIASLFGTNNETGLKTGLSPAQADNILLQIPETQQTVTIFYFSNNVAQGWFRADFSAASDQIVYPEQGVMVRRILPGNLDLFCSGPVKSGGAIVPVEQGFNLLGTLRSIGNLPLSALGLYTGSPLTGIASGLNPTASDNLLVVQPDGSTTTYFYFKDTHGNETWFDTSFNSANAVLINAGSAFFIHRKSANPAFNWSMPAQ